MQISKLSGFMLLKKSETKHVVANVDYQPEIKERDFYIFPYDMRHTVYPFNGPGIRRTLAANCDVKYDPIQNRGVS